MRQHGLRQGRSRRRTMRNSAGTWVFLLELKRGASSCAEALTCADDKRAFSGLASGISGRAPASAFSFQRRHSGGRFRPQLRVVASSSSARRARGRSGRRLQRFAEQVEQTRPGPLRVATVVAEDQADDESLVVVSRCIVRRGAAFGPVRFVEPAGGLVATLLELARQSLADLPRASLDLAPVARLDQQSFGEPAIETAQGGGVGVLDGGADEVVEQRHRVLEADLREVARLGRHGRHDKYSLSGSTTSWRVDGTPPWLLERDL